MLSLIVLPQQQSIGDSPSGKKAHYGRVVIMRQLVCLWLYYTVFTDVREWEGSKKLPGGGPWWSGLRAWFVVGVGL